jgi:nitric oxide reductase activation protein
VVRIKNPEERWSLAVGERLRRLEPVGYTRIGAAIRHGHHVLHDRIRLPNRLLILITDGVAYDQDYEHDYAAADARRALEEARSAGTACLALSVGAGAPVDDLAKVFGAANILTVDEIPQVTRRIREVSRHALATVSKRRFSRNGRSQRPR